MQEIPTLKPSKEEFDDPVAYLSDPDVSRLGFEYGMIKIIPPEDFKPGFNINESSFNFKCRLQTLCELDLKNRSRLFFWKQLNNFKRGTKNSILLLHPFDEDSKLYYYDLYMACVKYYNKPNQSDESYKRSRRKRSRNGTKFSASHIELTDPGTVMRDDKMWTQLGMILSCSPEKCKILFQSTILAYYRFLYDNSIRYGSDNLFDQLLYKQEYPKSLLEKDSDEDSPHTEETLFSDIPESFGDDEKDDYITDEDENDSCPVCTQIVSNVSSSRECESCKLRFHLTCLKDPVASSTEWVCNSCIIGNGYYGFKEPLTLHSLESFKNHCKEFDGKHFPHGKPTDIGTMEKLFWENVETISQHPLTVKYGADIHNLKPGEISGFPTLGYIPSRFQDTQSEEYKEYLKYVEHPWNLVNLPTAKGSLLSIIDRNISGMTAPWIYVGSTFSTFCWHLEDQYTLSANYQHQGEPKVWYSIPASSSESFNRMMKNTSPDLFARQPDLLHQLITLTSPYSSGFINNNIKCYKAVQHPGEFIITFPKCYHSGFNCGFNFNEAVNFTIDVWLLYGLESIKDYKVTKRTGVVNLFELMQNILEEYTFAPHKFDASFISTCIEEMKTWFNSEFKMLHKIKTIVHDEVYSESFNKMSHFTSQINTDYEWTLHSNEFPKRNTSKTSLGHNLRSSPEQNQTNAALSHFKSDRGQDTLHEYSDTDERYDDSEADKDVFCSNCKTICPLAFVVHSPQKRYPSQRRKFSSFTPNEWNLFGLKAGVELLCLEDYLKLVEKIEDEHNSSLDSGHENDDDFNYFDSDLIVYLNDMDGVRSLITKAERTLERKLR